MYPNYEIMKLEVTKIFLFLSLNSYHLDHSTLSYSDECKSQTKESALEINYYKWKNVIPSIEISCSHQTDNISINKIVNNDLDAKDNNTNEKSSYFGIESLILNTVFANRTLNNDKNIREIHIDNDLHVIYQDYRLLNDILDMSKGQLSDNNLVTNTSFDATDSMKPWFSLKNKILYWLKSNNKNDIVKKDLTSMDNRMDGESTDSQSSTDDKNYEHQKSKSQMIVEEIISTEKTFIDVLILLCKTFVSFVEDRIKIPSVELSKIFSPLPQLLSLSKFMLADMELRLENWNTEPKIADIIVSKGPFLKLYTTYIQNFKSQTNLLSDCCKKYPRFEKCVKDFEALDICNKLYIKQHMLAPIQRIPKYKLLLSRYLKSLDKDSIDYKNTITALDIISNVGQEIDKSVENGVSSKHFLVFARSSFMKIKYIYIFLGLCK